MLDNISMKLCLKCQKDIPSTKLINGKLKNLQNRKYCLDCSPFGMGNTRKLHLCSNEKTFHSSNYRFLSIEDKKTFNRITYKYQRQQRMIRKIELVNKFGGKCQICGYAKNLSALCFHHREPKEKMFMLNCREFYARSMEELENEANKCDLLCHNCHFEIHNELMNNWQTFKSQDYSKFANEIKESGEPTGLG